MGAPNGSARAGRRFQQLERQGLIPRLPWRLVDRLTRLEMAEQKRRLSEEERAEQRAGERRMAELIAARVEYLRDLMQDEQVIRSDVAGTGRQPVRVLRPTRQRLHLMLLE